MIERKNERPQDRWNRQHGLISKSYKLQASVVKRFSDSCQKKGVSQKQTLEKLMNSFCDEVERNNDK